MPKYPAFVVLFLLLIIPVQNGMWAYGHSESIGIEYPFNECGWWIPEVGAGPAYFGCTPPDAYTFAECQGCAEEVTSGDAYCESVTWDVVCYNAYNACLVSNDYPGCECGWWIPEVGTGPAYFGCTPPDAYTFAECQGCAEEVTSGDAYCESVTWDVLCNNAYNACLVSNDYPGCGCGWWIPEIGVGPAYFGCTPADSYTLADCQPCAEEVVNNDQYCVD